MKTNSHLPAILPLCFLTAALAGSALSASREVLDNDPSQWTGHDVYQILNNSPWTRAVKVNLANLSSGSLGDDAPAGGSTANNTPAPNTGAMGRRGMGGGRSSGTYSSGSRSSAPSAPQIGSTAVTVQWQSAVVVQMAAAKKGGETIDPASFKPANEYVIAVIGLPITAVGGPAASADSANTITQEQEQRIEAHVKSSASLLRSGHDPLTPTKVELDQGADGRMLIHFPKSDPISANEGTIEFQLALGKSHLRRKFPLKEMEFQGKLSL